MIFSTKRLAEKQSRFILSNLESAAEAHFSYAGGNVCCILPGERRTFSKGFTLGKKAESRCLQQITSLLIKSNRSVVVINREELDPNERGYDILVR